MNDPINNRSNTPAVTQTLLDTAAANGTFNTFATAIEKAGMSETLRGKGPYTVFAPTDEAFKKLPAGKLDSLFEPKNKAELVGILNYHVVKGNKSAADIGKWQAANTVNGQSAPVKITEGVISIDGADIVLADLASSNGVIHGIDKVNLPHPTRH